MRKKRKNRKPFWLIPLCGVVLIAAGVTAYKLIPEKSEDTLVPVSQVSVVSSSQTEITEITEETTVTEPEEVIHTRPYKSENTKEMDVNFVTAENSLLIDADTYEIFGRHNSLAKMYPASMTKVMTLLVAVEHLSDEQMSDTVTMTYDMLHPLIVENASRAGFEVDEEVTVKDLLYALILPSGADGAVGLCEYIAGGEENFVKLMNEKAEEMGLTSTHFTNSSGLHDKNHYTTCIEMAMIMKEAMENEECREILSTYQYTTSPTEIHPEGIPLTSTMFSRMYGTEVEGVTITSGKTGYTDEAGQCLVTYAEKGDKNYILVLAGDYERYQAVYSTFYAYENYLPD